MTGVDMLVDRHIVLCVKSLVCDWALAFLISFMGRAFCDFVLSIEIGKKLASDRASLSVFMLLRAVVEIAKNFAGDWAPLSVFVFFLFGGRGSSRNNGVA